MIIRTVKHVNRDEKDRVEFLLVNFDYFDGNELVARLFCQEFGMLSDKKIDGMFYSVIKLHKDSTEYDLFWHEDVGNYVFTTHQDDSAINELERRLEVIVNMLNEMVLK